MKTTLLRFLACPGCGGEIEAPGAGETIAEGALRCRGCGTSYPVHNRVPALLPPLAGKVARTASLYGDLWKSFAPFWTGSGPARRREGYRDAAPSHVELLRQAAGRELVEGEAGIDAGCGHGGSVLGHATRHPLVHFVGVDLSEGPETNAAAADELPNAHLVRGNLMAPPLRRESFDFAYSFGVLHHTPEPETAFQRLLECLKPGAPITLFVYKDFSDLPIKRLLLVPVTALRRLLVRLPPTWIRALGWLLAPAVFLFLTLPARALRRLGAKRLSRHIPYATFPNLPSIAGSLQDRFGAPYEYRFSRRDLEGWAERAGLVETRVVDCFELGFSGLVLSGRKRRS